MKVRVSPSGLAATMESTARTFNLEPGRLIADRRDAGLCLVDNKTGRELAGYRLTLREMDAALTIAAALADISPAIVQATATPFALQEGAIFLSAEQAAALKEAMRHLYNFTNGRAHQRVTGAQLALEKAAPIFDPAELRQTAAVDLRAAGHEEEWIAELVANGNAIA